MVVAAIALGLAVAAGGSAERAVAVVAGVAGLVWLAYVFPGPTMAVYFAATLFVGAFSERMPQSFYDIRLPFGVPPSDALLAGMVAAALLRLVVDRTERKRGNGALVAAGVALGCWLAFEVVRGIPTYGFSAPAEFGQRYLMLGGALFVAANWSAPKFQRQAIRILVATPGLVAAPAIIINGLVTGWLFGAQHRFVHSSVTLALVFASTVVLLDMAYGVFKLPRAYWAVLAVALFSFLVDAHRSVWLAAAVILLLMIVAGWTRLSRLAVPIVASIPLLVLLGAAFPDRALSTWSFFDERTTAFRNPLSDQTAAWRAYVWLATLQQVAVHPWAGTGFGGYWEDLYIPELGRQSSIFPHSVYLMSLAKIGAIGLALYFGFVIASAVAMIREYRLLPTKSTSAAVVLLGLVGLVGAQVYGVAYGLEASAWLYVGLGFGGVLYGTSMKGATLA